MKNKIVWFMSGCQASGKSTFAKKYAEEKNGIVFSRDDIREKVLNGRAWTNELEHEVFDAWINLVQNAINDENGPDVIILDATHPTRKSRRRVIERLNVSNCKVGCIYMTTPLRQCFKRNDTRDADTFIKRKVIRQCFKSAQYGSFEEPYLDYIIEVNKNGNIAKQWKRGDETLGHRRPAIDITTVEGEEGLVKIPLKEHKTKRDISTGRII